MTVDEIFARLASHMREGAHVHDTISRAYDFIGLCGFAKCHAYHFIEETKGYECLVHYYSAHYHKLLTIDDAPKHDLIPSTWYKYATKDVDVSTKRQATRDLMKAWADWETETKKLYQDMYKELCDLGEIMAAEKVKCYVFDVEKELIYVEKKLIKLETLDYNIGKILSWQKPMYDKYKKKLK